MTNKFWIVFGVFVFNFLAFAGIAGPVTSPTSTSTSVSDPGLQMVLFNKIYQINPSETSVIVTGMTPNSGGGLVKEIKFKTDNQLGKVCIQQVQTAFLASIPFALEIFQADSAGNLKTCRLSAASNPQPPR